ncbi:hypothetical protein H6P81_019798 [Aristolochia fimbriata]|uniref:Uncharacterized protein n=1 Tax=Aristolochia fimbriata TaxID=158543 RepID=A0AAV7DTP5_ARIFI|nr:hypothetical protein H6P81_019798 [Aristolochia fimbriata]
MASACVNNIGMATEGFLDCPSFPSYGWLSPRISFSRDFVDDGGKAGAGEKAPAVVAADKPQKPVAKVDPEPSSKDLIDFEFRLDDPVAMLPADELFSDGKLVPLQLAAVRPTADSTASSSVVQSPDAIKSRRRIDVAGSDPYLFSPKAPRCSSRWRELLGLKKTQNPKPELQKASSVPSKNPNPKSLKHFLHRSNKSSSSVDSSLSLPLLRDSDCESVSISSRLSLSSSSSSGPDHEDLPRLSLDSDKPNSHPIVLSRNPPRLRVSKPRNAVEQPRALDHPAGRKGRSSMRRAPESTSVPVRGVSVDSPRMNSSGKIVFQSLERSSSSPSSFNGGSRNTRHRGMERSYSANVRVTPVLNVPVCSLRGSSKTGSVFGFGQLFSPQKKDGGGVRVQSRSRGDRT